MRDHIVFYGSIGFRFSRILPLPLCRISRRFQRIRSFDRIRIQTFLRFLTGHLGAPPAVAELAGAVAYRHTGGEVITAAIDNLIFKEPCFLNDLIVLKGKITHIGKTSMEVQVHTYVEGKDGQRKMINQAFLVMVSLDENGQPQPIPPVELAGEKEEAAWRDGEKRYQLRKQRRIEKY